MKNNLFKSAALVAVMAMTMSGCSNEELVNSGDNKEDAQAGITQIIASTQTDNPNTRVEYTEGGATEPLVVKWKPKSEVVEQFYVITDSGTGQYKATAKRTDDGSAASSAKFILYTSDGTAVSLKAERGLIAFYPIGSASGLDDYFNKGWDLKTWFTLPLTDQTGKLADMTKYNYMAASVASLDKASSSTLELKFKNHVAVMRLHGLTFPTELNGQTVTDITIEATGLKDAGKIDMASGFATYVITPKPIADAPITTTGSFTIGADGKLTENVYICFFPGNADADGTYEISDLKVTATVGSDTYKYDYGNDDAIATKVTKFEEGKMYTMTNKTMTKLVLGDTAFANELSVDGSSWEQAYEIDNLARLKLLAERVNGNQSASWNSKYYKLTANINLGDGNDAWTPIGVGSGIYFTGSFDGGDCSISGTLKIASTDYAGIFGYLKGDATIKNLHFTGTIDASAMTNSSRLGAIVGQIADNSVILNCSNTANISTSGTAGGIVGYPTSNSKIEACVNSGTIVSSASAGGIAGSSGGSIPIIGCINKGLSITGGGSGNTNAGGIIGFGNSVACWSIAESISASYAKGAIIGRVSNAASYCYWKGISGVNGAGDGVITNGASFGSANQPMPEQITAMNTAWQTANSDREYQFNATTGEIEKIVP